VGNALAALDEALNIGIETQTFHHLDCPGTACFDLLKQTLERNPAERRTAAIMDRIRALPDVARAVIGGLAPAALPHSPSLRFYGFGPGKNRKGRAATRPPPPLALGMGPGHLTFSSWLHPPAAGDQIIAAFLAGYVAGEGRAIFPLPRSIRIPTALEAALSSCTRRVVFASNGSRLLV